MDALLVKTFHKGPKKLERDHEYLDAVVNRSKESYEDNASASVSTESTNATADDIPEPGRIIDVYMY